MNDIPEGRNRKCKARKGRENGPFTKASNFHGSCQGNQEMQKMRLERFVKDLEGPLKGLDLVARLVVSCRGTMSRGRVGRCHWASGERRVGKG